MGAAARACGGERGVVDSLESQNLEKLPNIGSNGFYTTGYTQNAVDFNKKSNGGHIKNPAPEIENVVSTVFRGAPKRTRILSLTEKRLTSRFREHANGDGPSKMQYEDNFSSQIWQLSLIGNVPGWRKRRGETSSSYPWVRALMNTRHWDKVDPFSCQLRKLVGHNRTATMTPILI